MITQIYSLKTVDEALACIEVGATNIGVNPTAKNSGKTFDEALAESKAIFDAVGDKATKVALTIDDTEEERTKIIETLHPDILHISGAEDDATPELIAELKAKYPGMKIMQAVPMTGPEAIDKAIAFSKFCDLLILDSVLTGVIGTGAAGVTHDWAWDKAIVDGASCPVIIAGGLGPDNVADAIKAVRPYGVDSLTKTNKNGTNLGEKDIEKVRLFCERAHATAKELGI